MHQQFVGYPKHREGKPVSGVMFEAWRGRHADSPMAISEALLTLRPDLKHWWATSDGVAPRPGVRAVRRHSPNYFRRLLTADYLVTNDIITKHLVKGPGVEYVQCWHGTPLKAIGHDEVEPKYRGGAAHLRRVDRDVAKWDYLVSPSSTCTALLRSAFHYDGTVLETGYPRNDVLVRDDGSIRERVRRHLEIAEDTIAVLYAPTWRDDSKGPDGRLLQPEWLDLGLMRRGLPDTVLLSRLHPNLRATAEALPGFTIDVGAHPDIAELYLAADVLVSDYSSAIYDFAVTGKPIVLFAPDLEHYRNELRPLYFDYEEWAPGPITSTTCELVEVLRDLDDVKRSAAARYGRFRETFCPFDDGHASERVVEAVFR